MNDWELLQEFATSRSEHAFRQLVERHGGMVLASANRQLRDEHAAEDVAQAAFILLARKAPQLRRGTVVAGWLLQTTRFLAARALRSEMRRHRREQEAITMQQLTSDDDIWRRMAPVIDDALTVLESADRDAILLRYMRGHSMREVAETLGVNEEAAKKRVTRAMERLRKTLQKRGVTAAASVIAGGLASQSSAAAPAAWVANTASIAMAETTASAGVAALVADAVAAARMARLWWAGGGVVLIAVVALLFNSASSPRPSTNPEAPVASVATELPAGSSTDRDTAIASSVANGMQRLKISVLAAASGEPISGVRLIVSKWTRSSIDTHDDLRTGSSGECDVDYPEGTGRIDVGVLMDGWETRYGTWPSEGRSGIPLEYTFRLAAVTNAIGGWLRDTSGHAVVGAEIWFSGHESGDSSHRERPRERFGFWNEFRVARTDQAGRWALSSVPPRNPGFSISARHPEFADTQLAYSRKQDNALELEDTTLRALWQGTLISTMRVAFTLTGTVQDEAGAPITSATVQRNTSGPSYRTDAMGQFQVPGLPAGEWQFTVAAEGFAPLRTSAMAGPRMQPMVITLQTGAVLRVRVVDEHGMEVPDAEVGMEQWGVNRHDIDWRGKTDSNGLLEWRSAPRDAVLELFARKDGYCYTRNVHLKADGREHAIRLRHSLVVFGRVVDAGSGELIPDFRAVPAYGGYGSREERWFAGSTVRGTNGQFRLAFDEKEGPWLVRIMAAGYQDWTSESLEGDVVTLDIPLKKAARQDGVRGVVLGPDGSPVSGAQVALLTFEHNVNLTLKGRFEGNQRWMVESDGNGAFAFPFNELAHSVAATAADGFAQTRLNNAAMSVTLRLERWGRVEGVVDASAAVHGLSTVQLYDPAGHNFEGEVRLLSHFAATPDPNRRFVFGKVPPGEFSVFVNSGIGIPFHHKTDCQVLPGETTTVVITNPPGTRVTGRFTAPPSQTISWKDDCTLIHLYADGQAPQPPKGTAAEQRAWALDFWTSAAGREYLSRPRVYSGAIGHDSTFVMLDPVVPGKYRFTAVFGRRGERNISVTRHLTIPDQAGFDLGELRLE